MCSSDLSLVETHAGSDPANAFRILDRFRELVNEAGRSQVANDTTAPANHDDDNRSIFWDDPIQRRGLATVVGGYRPDHYDHYDYHGATGSAAESFVASSRR